MSLRDRRPQILQSVLAFRLIEIFHQVQFNRSIDYLADLVTDEADQDFFQLWELADSLVTLRQEYSETSDRFERLSRRLERLFEKLRELGLFEFQHLVRL